MLASLHHVTPLSYLYSTFKIFNESQALQQVTTAMLTVKQQSTQVMQLNVVLAYYWLMYLGE